ncbi:PAS domain-containing protein [Selenomonas sp. AE3005]|uniref:PAS domain-containing protein n=1 Tax=Selenomonas sp. AE3005 TaxID=1485543 RepID=UPI000484F8AF|nr:PAS domain-containing protein [Selenomonas sp. AE3005]
MKKIDFYLTVAELVKDNPEVRKILSALGMGKLITPEALQVMGNIMTIPRAAVIQGVALADVVQAFTDAGFAVVNGEPSPAENLTCQLTSQVDRSIGLPQGHPVSLLRAENAGLGAVLDSIAAQLSGRGVPDAAIVIKALQDFNGVRAHYAKKEELLMAQLYKYGVTGPSQVMWDEDDEIKKELGTLTRAVMDDADNVLIYKGRIAALVEKARGMMAKEEKILFPLCLRFFTAEEWKKIYRDFPEMGMAFVEKPAKWEEGENWAADELGKVKGLDILAGKILLPTGELTVKQLSALLALLPLDLTFIDAEEKLRFFINEGRVFPRPLAALGRDVAECHPPHIVPVVRNLVADFKAKKRSSLEVARYIMGKPILVKYMAVYGDDGEYMGTLEVVQNCEHILEKFGQQ